MPCHTQPQPTPARPARANPGVWIQAHPSREHLHPALIASLAPLPVELSLHSSNPPNPWAGYKLALERAIEHPTQYTHLLVLQDDVIVCADFPLAVTAAIEERPEQVLSLWVGALSGRTRKDFWIAQGRKERWSPLYFRDIVNCVGLVWPRPLAEEFLEWTSDHRLPGDCRQVQSDDAIIGAWARRTHQRVWATVPSLIEHPDEVESTIGRPRGGKDRRAISYIDSP